MDGKYNPATGSPTMDEPQLSLSSYPGNDDFEDAYRLGEGGPPGGTFGSYGLGNVGATEEAGEPVHAGNGGGSSVWFRWRSSGSGSVRMNVCDATFHTLVSVYTGSELEGLTPIAEADDPQSPRCDPFAVDPSYEVGFNVEARTEYRIAVDGYDGATGRFGLELQTSGERLPVPGAGQATSPPVPGLPPPSATARPRTKIARAHVDRRRDVVLFGLRSDEPRSSFLCKLDSRAFVACGPTVVYRHLKPGRHTFRSMAVNSAGEADRTPATFRFRVGPR